MRQELEKLKALAEAATPGPWEVWKGSLRVFAGPATENKPHVMSGYRQEVCEIDEYGPKSKANTKYIAAANPTVILGLLTALATAEEALEKARGLLTESQLNLLKNCAGMAAYAKQDAALATKEPCETQGCNTCYGTGSIFDEGAWMDRGVDAYRPCPDCTKESL